MNSPMGLHLLKKIRLTWTSRVSPCRGTPKEQKKSPDWPPTPRAWLNDGELRTAGVFEDLASEIVMLTNDDLDLQRRLLTENCQQYAPTHIWSLVEKWEERAAILQYDVGMPREEAELEAARKFHLKGFLDELRQPGRQIG